MKECHECGVMYAEEDGRGGVCRRCYERHQTGSMEKDSAWFAHQAGQPKKKY